MKLSDEPILITIIVPMYNEAENIHPFFNHIKPILEQIGYSWEIICVNDGSEDATLAYLVSYHQQDPRIKIIDFSRNFGKEYALSAGINYATGDAVITIDSDLQHPPETLVEFIEYWKSGSEIVFGVRHSREKEKRLKRFLSKAFYDFFGKISHLPNHHKIGDFCLLDKKVVKILKQLPEQNRFMKGLIAWVGFKQDFVTYQLQNRNAGETKWNYWRLWNFAIQGITSFSTVLLRVWTYVGFGLSAISILYAGKIVIEKLFFGIGVPGYASLMVAISFLGGVQLISMGIVGEYIGRIYIEIKSRPIYLVRNLYGLDDEME